MGLGMEGYCADCGDETGTRYVRNEVNFVAACTECKVIDPCWEGCEWHAPCECQTLAPVASDE